MDPSPETLAAITPDPDLRMKLTMDRRRLYTNMRPQEEWRREEVKKWRRLDTSIVALLDATPFNQLINTKLPEVLESEPSSQ